MPNSPLAHALTRPELTPAHRASTADPQDLTPQLVQPAIITALTDGNQFALYTARGDLPAYIYRCQVDVTAAFESGFVGRLEVGVWSVPGGRPVASTTDLIVGDPDYTLIDTWIDEADGYSRFPLRWEAPWEGWPESVRPSQVIAARFSSSSSSTFDCGVKIVLWVRV